MAKRTERLILQLELNSKKFHKAFEEAVRHADRLLTRLEKPGKGEKSRSKKARPRRAKPTNKK